MHSFATQCIDLFSKNVPCTCPVLLSISPWTIFQVLAPPLFLSFESFECCALTLVRTGSTGGEAEQSMRRQTSEFPESQPWDGACLARRVRPPSDTVLMFTVICSHLRCKLQQCLFCSRMCLQSLDQHQHSRRSINICRMNR